METKFLQLKKKKDLKSSKGKLEQKIKRKISNLNLFGSRKLLVEMLMIKINLDISNLLIAIWKEILLHVQIFTDNKKIEKKILILNLFYKIKFILLYAYKYIYIHIFK